MINKIIVSENRTFGLDFSSIQIVIRQKSPDSSEQQDLLDRTTPNRVICNSGAQEVFSMGYSKVVIIGSDLYDLTTQDLRDAFHELENHQVVLGPAADGGYYLLGMKALKPELFKNKKWGTSTVLEDTLNNLRNTTTYILPVRNDVDRYEDIEGNPIFESIISESNE